MGNAQIGRMTILLGLPKVLILGMKVCKGVRTEVFCILAFACARVHLCTSGTSQIEKLSPTFFWQVLKLMLYHPLNFVC